MEIFKLEAYNKDSDIYTKVLESTDVQMLMELGENLAKRFELKTELGNGKMSDPMDWYLISNEKDKAMATTSCEDSGLFWKITDEGKHNVAFQMSLGGAKTVEMEFEGGTIQVDVDPCVGEVKQAGISYIPKGSDYPVDIALVETGNKDVNQMQNVDFRLMVFSNPYSEDYIGNPIEFHYEDYKKALDID